MLLKKLLSIFQNKKIIFILEILGATLMIIMVLFVLISAESQVIDFVYDNF